MKRSRTSSSDSDSLAVPDRIVKKPCAPIPPPSPSISPVTFPRQLLTSPKQKQLANCHEENVEDANDGPSDNSDLEPRLAPARSASISTDPPSDSADANPLQDDDWPIYYRRFCPKLGFHVLTGEVTSGGSEDDFPKFNMRFCPELGIDVVTDVEGPLPLPLNRRKASSEKATGALELFSLTLNSLAPKPRAVAEEPLSPRSFPTGGAEGASGL